jgi:heme oxygenase
VHAALEQGLGRAAAQHDAVPTVMRNDYVHSPRLRADIAAMGGNPDDVTALPATTALLDQIQTVERKMPVALLGLLYVLEGSTNGGKYLAMALAKAWQMAPGKPGLSYLDPYGEAQRGNWAEFRQNMIDANFTNGEGDALVAAAKLMFTGIASVSDAVHATAPGARVEAG